jgi:hypothetical protein
MRERTRKGVIGGDVGEKERENRSVVIGQLGDAVVVEASSDITLDRVPGSTDIPTKVQASTT